MSALLLFRAVYGRVLTAQAVGSWLASAWLPSILLLACSAHAQIIADPNAPGRQRPTVLDLVNIQRKHFEAPPVIFRCISI